jgi:hypothetical protein
MFTREESSRIHHEFWTTFGRYMSPVPSAEGLKINWINYHTRIKDLYFRMHADSKSAMISISMEHRNPEIQKLYFNRFKEFKTLLHESLGEPWKWKLHATVDDKVVSRIYKQIDNVSVLNKNDWPELISFFKPRMIALDAFWADAKYSFEQI